jgi:hypothetical protein
MNNITINNKKITPLIVKKEDFNIDFIKKLDNTKYLKIEGKYILTKKDYNNLMAYSNIETIDVYDIEDFDYENEIKVNIEKNIEFNSEQYKKLNINKINRYNKTSLTINLPFNLFFKDDCLYNEEDDFEKLLKYIDSIEILNINIKQTDLIDEIIKNIWKIENKINKKIKFINIITENKTINNLEKLKFLEDGRIVKIWYEDGITDCTIDEFITMRNNIDSIVNDAKQKKLTNLEKIIYVYDIVKKFNYQKSQDNYSMEGRQLHKIFNTNKIVCSGYTRIISQVLNELGIQTGIYKLITNNNELHARNLVHIIDETYNINSIYSMEPTWESAFRQENSYGLFLTPINKLKEYFPKEIFRGDIDVLCGKKTIDEISLKDRISLYQFFNNKDLTQKEIDEKIKLANNLIELNIFQKALIKVKIAEGVDKNIIEENVDKIISYNESLTDYLNKKMGTNLNFF